MAKTVDNRKVALLVPAYNCQEHLDITIRTLPAEEPLHILIIDDGSTPPLRALECDRVHDLQIVRNESNLGIHGALRRGMQILHAEGFAYVARLDAGDFALPMRFRLQKEFLDRHPDTAVVGSAFERADDDGRLLCTMHAPTTDPAIRRLKILSLCLEHPTVMMRVDAVAAVGNYGDAYPCAEDMDLFLRLMRQYKVANLPEVLTRIVVYENGITVRRRRRMIISTIRLQARDFRAACWADWAGIAKCVSQLLLPRSLFEHLKLIYLRGDPYRGKPSSAGGA